MRSGGLIEGDRDLEKGTAWIADVEVEVEGCYETKPSGAIVLTTTGHQGGCENVLVFLDVYADVSSCCERVGKMIEY